MSLEAIYFISQVIAAVALVGSLIFVGVQIRQVNQRQRREAKRRREEFITGTMSRWADDRFGPLFARGSAADTTLSDAEIARYHFSIVSLIISLRSRFDEHQEGLLSTADWEKLRGSIRFWLGSPGFRAVYLVSQKSLRPDPEFDAEFAEALAAPSVDRHKMIASAWRETVVDILREVENSGQNHQQEADPVPAETEK